MRDTLEIEFGPIALPEGGSLVIPVLAERGLGAEARRLDAATDGLLTRAMRASRFTGKREETLAIPVPAGLAVDRVLLVGAGKPERLEEPALAAVGGSLVAALDRSGEEQAAVLVEPFAAEGVPPIEPATQVALGARLRAYRFGRYKTRDKPEQLPSLARVTVMCAEPDVARRHFERLAPVAEGVHLARDLVTEPPNVLTPVGFAERCTALAAHGVAVEIFDAERIADIGMRTILAVAQGSAAPPRVVAMRHWGAANPEDAPVAFVGKGITFDSGGLSIKTAGSMEDMKWDMGGAAVVVGLMHALAKRRAPLNVVGLVGLAENMPSGTAQRPGDVVTSLSGQTIEVLNTDAEGRLVLADLLWYVQEVYKPRRLINLATLTGAVIVALGHEHAGLFTNDDDLASRLGAAGRAVGEQVWRLPLAEAYDKELNSEIADVKNISGSRDGGSIIAAQFLQRFVQAGVPWAHLDIAGVTWAKKDSALAPKGGTGFGVRLLDRYVADHLEPREG